MATNNILAAQLVGMRNLLSHQLSVMEERHLQELQWLRGNFTTNLDALEASVAAASNISCPEQARDTWDLVERGWLLYQLVCSFVAALRSPYLSAVVLSWGRRPGGGPIRFVISLALSGVLDVPTLVFCSIGFLWNSIESFLRPAPAIPAPPAPTTWREWLAELFRWPSSPSAMAAAVSVGVGPADGLEAAGAQPTTWWAALRAAVGQAWGSAGRIFRLLYSPGDQAPSSAPTSVRTVGVRIEEDDRSHGLSDMSEDGRDNVSTQC